MGAVALPLAIAATAVSAYGSIKAGQDKKKYYDMVAQQTRVEGERKSIQYQLQANQILQRTNAANSAVIARAFAGGTQGFQGSAGLVQAINNTRGGKEFAFALSNSDSARRNSLIQATLYEDAGSTAERTGYFDAFSKIGMAALTYGTLGGAQAAGGLPVSSTTGYSTGMGGFSGNPLFTV
jgi:hypothetical protein